MIRHSLSIFLVLVSFCSACGQDYFQLVRDFDSSVIESGRSIVEKNKSLYVATNGISTESPKVYLSKYNAKGDLVWDIVLLEFFAALNTMHQLDADKIVLTGVDLNGQFQSTLYIDTSGVVVKSVNCISDSLLSANISSTTKFAEYLVTTKNSFVNNETDTNTEICWLNLESGLVDSLIIEDNGFSDQIGDILVGPDSLLTVVYRHQDPDNKADYYRSIHKFNKQKEKVWEWASERFSSSTSRQGFTLAILDDGRMVHTTGRITFPENKGPALNAINPDGSLSWHYDFPIFLPPTPIEEFFTIDLIHLIRTENNDLVGCGWYKDYSNKGYIPNE